MNPWLGLNSYQEGDTIYGRSDEILSLTNCILSNTQTVLYGRSGIGKTSILNAGVFPLVRKKSVFPVSIRLEHNADSYISQLSRAIEKSINNLRKEIYNDSGEKSIVIENGTIKERVKRINENYESLWEIFHRLEYYDADGNRIIPLILFDQFEEIFTIEKDKSKVRDFFTELASLINGVIPDYINDATDDYSDTASSVTKDPLAFSIVDFNVSEERYEDYLTSSDFHLVFSLREDFLPYLERETVNIPALRQNRYCLQPINEEQAAIIIMNPIRGLVEPAVAKLIIQKVCRDDSFELDGIPEISVDSAILSLFLSRLYDRLGPNDSVISSSLVESEADNIIVDFYNEAIEGLPSETVEFLENHLINGEGRRENISVYNAQKEGNISDNQLDKLINDSKLLRLFDYGGVQRIEYVHDVLCPIVMHRKEQRAALKEQQLIERKNKEESERLEKENRLVLEKKKRNKRVALLLAFFTVILAVASVYILKQANRLDILSTNLNTAQTEINSILPLAIEQFFIEGKPQEAGSLICRLFPDSLYIKGDSLRTYLLRKYSYYSVMPNISLIGHQGKINVARFFDDGRMIATGSDDYSVKLWDASGRLVQSIPNSNHVLSLDINKDSNLMVTATRDGWIRTYSISNGFATQSDTILINKIIRFIKFNPTGTQILACCTDGEVRVLDSGNLKNNYKFDTPGEGVTFISYDKTGRKAAFSGADNSITIRDAIRPQLILKRLLGHEDWVRSAVFDPLNDKRLVSCSDDQTVRLWNINSDSSKVLVSLPVWLTRAYFAPDGTRIHTSSKDGILRTYIVKGKDDNEFKINEVLPLQKKQSGYLEDFDISPNGKHIVTCSSLPYTNVLYLGEPWETNVSYQMRRSVFGLAALKDTTLFAASSYSGELNIFSPNCAQPIYSKEFVGRSGALSSSSNTGLIAFSAGSHVNLYDYIHNKVITVDQHNGHTNWVRSLCFSHNGKILASVGDDRSIVLWDIDSCKVYSKRRIEDFDICKNVNSIYSVDFRYDDRLLVIGTSTRTGASSLILQFSVDSLKPVGNPIGIHQKAISKVLYNSDGSKVLSASNDNTACLWTVDGSLPVQKFVGASGSMNDAIFSRDEEEIITASTDNTIRIWAINGEKETAQINGHLSGVQRLTLLDDGSLISSDSKGTIKVWKIPDLQSVADELGKTSQKGRRY